ncbi:putative actin-rearrangement-inducing factor [Mamestra configurata nucleopolyhedrovirus B]|uniref:Arif-1 n=1 Tax=Mamestra configurata nucleopolyhedrovirus B TaxID=204440 RepID=Q8JMB0_9ABAC|nr:putative actin-rearrangement-inducing factor [Mamestra configurata nucleopolyhedrovirus B]AAM95029.1 putative actin-rearrangement-inducing factor [Mamestra configurata nucleopolyhedrovirus B]QNH90690.1 arif-1 [Mamestra configurata nucleopolyhedrovirus B]
MYAMRSSTVSLYSSCARLICACASYTGLYNKNKNIITHTNSNKYMAVSLSCIVLSTTLNVIGCIAVTIGCMGMINPNAALIIDYENGTGMFNCSGFVFVYGVLLICVGLGIVFLPKLPWHLATTLLCLIIIVCLCTLSWIVRYGHVAILDVHVREHDVSASCWGGVYVNDFNNIQVPQTNCFFAGSKMYCVRCRNEYYRDEPTFVRTYRFTIVFVMLALLALNAWSFAVSYKKYIAAVSSSQSISTQNTSARSSLNSSSSHYMVPKNNQPIVSYDLLPPPPPSWIFHDKV